jgi:flagellar export protein FliJ
MNAAKRARRLDLVAGLARHKRLTAEKALADSQREVQRRRDTLAQLCSFRDEYDSPARRDRAGTISVTVLQEYDEFRDKLALAIAQQRKELIEAEQAAAGLRTALAAATQRAETLDMAVDRYRRLADRHQADSEQRLLDEIATLSASRGVPR